MIEFFKHQLHSEKRSLGIQSIKNSLDHNHIHAALNQGVGRFHIGFNQLIKGYVARTGIIHIR